MHSLRLVSNLAARQLTTPVKRMSMYATASIGRRLFQSKPPTTLGYVMGAQTINEFRETFSIDNELDYMQKQLSERVDQASLRAQSNKKKLLVVISEDHFDRRSLIIQLFVLSHISQRYGIKNVLIETDPALTDAIRSRPNTLHFNPKILITVADKLGININPLFGAISKEELLPQIKQSLIKFNKPGLMVVSAKLITLVDEDKDLSEMYEVLPINATTKMCTGVEPSEYNWHTTPLTISNPHYVRTTLSPDLCDLFIPDLTRICAGIEVDNEEQILNCFLR